MLFIYFLCKWELNKLGIAYSIIREGTTDIGIVDVNIMDAKAMVADLAGKLVACIGVEIAINLVSGKSKCMGSLYDQIVLEELSLEKEQDMFRASMVCE